MAKVWKNRILAGTQKYSDCPSKYKADVVALIKEDLESGAITKSDLKRLVEDDMLYKKDYKAFTGEDYVAD